MAIGSYLGARAAGGRWLVRIEDIDPPREIIGAGDAILRTLGRLGLEWDGRVIWQRKNRDQHHAALQQLGTAGQVYRCDCSRQLLSGKRYPGTCRDRALPIDVRHAIRWRVPAGEYGLVDRIQGEFKQDVQATFGDFVVWRAEDLPAYHLASVIDDAAAGVTEVIRGADLLDSTPRQLALLAALRFPVPRYGHLPVARDEHGDKLSKQTGALAVDTWPPSRVMSTVLEVLGHAPPRELWGAPAPTLLEWAIAHWRIEAIPRQVPARDWTRVLAE